MRNRDTSMTGGWLLRQHSDDPPECVEEGCLRPTYDSDRCKLHADTAAYRQSA